MKTKRRRRTWAQQEVTQSLNLLQNFWSDLIQLLTLERFSFSLKKTLSWGNHDKEEEEEERRRTGRKKLRKIKSSEEKKWGKDRVESGRRIECEQSVFFLFPKERRREEEEMQPADGGMRSRGETLSPAAPQDWMPKPKNPTGLPLSLWRHQA